MKNKLLYLLLAIPAISSYAQNKFTDNSTTLVAYWKKGTVKTFEIKEKTSSYQNDTLEEDKTEIDTIHFIIKEEHPKDYQIEWEYLGHSSTDTTDALPKKLNDKLNKKFGNLTVQYSTSETGAFNKIENWEKLSKAFCYIFDESIKEEKKGSKFEVMMQQLKDVYKTQNGIENLFNRYISTYHYLYGVEYAKDNPYYLETSIPNLFGGTPFPAKLAVRLDSVNTKDGLAYLSINQSIDKEKAKENILEIIQKLSGEKMNADAANELELFSINDKMKYVVSLEEGWVEQYEFTRTVKVNDAKKVTRLSINLVN
jgi:hypothetical protein